MTSDMDTGIPEPGARTFPAPGARTLPALTPDNSFFWTSGRDGRLRFQFCEPCARYIHPPAPRCPHCLALELRPAPVSGCGSVYSVTINHHQWSAAMPPPYAIAIVELIEQRGLRLTSNVLGCAPDEVRIGMSVHVHFENHDPIFVPVFRPSPDAL